MIPIIFTVKMSRYGEKLKNASTLRYFSALLQGAMPPETHKTKNIPLFGGD